VTLAHALALSSALRTALSGRRGVRRTVATPVVWAMQCGRGVAVLCSVVEPLALQMCGLVCSAMLCQVACTAAYIALHSGVQWSGVRSCTGRSRRGISAVGSRL